MVDKEAEYSQLLMAETTNVADKTTTTDTYVYGNGLLGKEDTSGYHVYHFNQVGSTTAITNEQGSIEHRFTYDTYGKVTSGDTTVSMFLYNGLYGVQTDENGLYYMRDRYYNVDIKRFINQDTVTGDIKNSQSLNRYCYVQGNPVTQTDPFGLAPQDDRGYWSKLGHSLLNLAGFLPGLGDVADVVNCAWYLAEKDYANALSSAISALPGVGSMIGSTLRLGFKCSTKAVKAAQGIESVCSLVGNTATMARATASGVSQASQMVKKYAIDGESADGNTWKEVTTLGLDIVTTFLSGKGLKKNISDLSSLNHVVAKSACFVAGTAVKTNHGDQAIERVKVGDKVLSQNAETGKKTYKKVTKLYHNQSSELVHLRIYQETIITTMTHPFWVIAQGAGSWVEAGSLKTGDIVLLSDGQEVPIQSVAYEKLEKPVNVYNLEVEGNHTYFVSSAGVLVHNKCGEGGKGSTNPNALKYNGDGTWTSNEGLIYGQGSKDGNRVKHVLAHTQPNPNKPQHTVFNVDKTNVIGTVDEAWVNKGDGILQANGNVLYDVDMGRIIGTNGENTLRIISKGYSNNIITAFPKGKEVN